MQELDDYIAKAEQLPPAPQTLLHLMRLLNELDIDSGKVVELIAYDPTLTANVLQVCNSAYFGGADRVVHVEEAVGRVGFEAIYRIAAAVCGARLVAPLQSGWGVESRTLWRHSVAAALAAQMVARELGEDPNLAFTSGILHDLGKIVFASALQHIYAALVAETERDQTSLLEAETRRLDLEHAEMGGRLLARWAFPPSLVAAVRFHHQPAAAGEYRRAAACVCLGDMIAWFLGHRCGDYAYSFRGRDEAFGLLGLSAERLPGLLNLTLENVSMIEVLLNLHA